MKNSRSIVFGQKIRRHLRLLPALTVFFVFTAVCFFPFSPMTTVTVAIPTHEPMYWFFEAASLEQVMTEADEGKHDPTSIAYFAEEVSRNVSVRAGYEGYIVITLVHFHSDAFALSESDFSTVALFLAQRYIATYSYAEAKALLINFDVSPQASSDILARLSELKSFLFCATERVGQSTDAWDETEESDVYFSELCRSLSPECNAQAVCILKDLRALLGQTVQFIDFLCADEEYLLEHPALAEQEYERLCDGCSQEISKYNAVVMQMARQIGSKYIFIEKVF